MKECCMFYGMLFFSNYDYRAPLNTSNFADFPHSKEPSPKQMFITVFTGMTNKLWSLMWE